MAGLYDFDVEAKVFDDVSQNWDDPDYKLETTVPGIDNPAYGPISWGTWTGTAVGIVSETATISTSWGTWTGTATGTVNPNWPATIATNWSPPASVLPTITDFGKFYGGDVNGSQILACTGINAVAGKLLVMQASAQFTNQGTGAGTIKFTVTDNIGDTGGTPWVSLGISDAGNKNVGLFMARVETFIRRVGTTPGSNKTITLTPSAPGGVTTGSGQTWANPVMVDGSYSWHTTGDTIPSTVGPTTYPQVLNGAPLTDSIVLSNMQDYFDQNVMTVPAGFTMLQSTFGAGGAAYATAYMIGNVPQTFSWGVNAADRIMGVAVELLAPSAPSPVYTDYFNRADGALTTPWVAVDSTYSIVNNKVPVGPADPTTVKLNQTIGDDQWAEADLAGWVNGGSTIGPCVRIAANGDLYYVWANAANVQIIKRVSGVYTTIATGTPWPSTFRARLEAQGTTIRLYVNGTLAATATDSSVSTGLPGFIGAGGAVATLDNFAAGTLGVVAATGGWGGSANGTVTTPSGAVDRPGTISTNWGSWTGTANGTATVQVAFDSVSGVANLNNAASGTNSTTTINIGTRVKVAVIYVEAAMHGTNSPGDPNVNVGTITLDGVAATHVPGAKKHSGSDTEQWGFTDLYYVLAPAAGTGKVLSWTPTITGGNISGSIRCIAYAASTAVDVGAALVANGANVASLSVSATLASGEIITGIAANGNTIPAVTAPGVSRSTNDNTNFTAVGRSAVADTAVSPLAFTTDTGDFSALSAVRLAPSVTTFSETFDSSAALSKFTLSRFRTDWAEEPIGNGITGQDANGNHGSNIGSDIRVTSGQLVVECGMQNYGESVLLSEGLWPLTGTFEFDLTNDANSEAYAVISFTDRPYAWTSHDGENANGPKPANGFQVAVSAPVCRIWNNYSQIDWYQNANASTQDPGSAGPPTGIVVDGTQQHWKIQITSGRVFVYINNVQATPEFNLPTAFVVGTPVWVRIGQHNHASIKYTGVESVTSFYDNLIYPQGTNRGRFATVAPSGTVTFGWHLETAGGTAPVVHSTSALTKGAATNAWLMANVGCYGDGDFDATDTFDYRLNGGTWHHVTMQYANHTVHGVFSMSIPVALSELVNGVNTVEVTGTGFVNAANTRYANVQIAVIDGGAVDNAATIATNWGSWTTSPNATVNRVATISTSWGTWTATAAGTVSETATIATNWGSWATSPNATVDRVATTPTNWGTWATSPNATVNRVATVATNWGTWTATAAGVVSETATISTNWGTWTAIANGDVSTPTTDKPGTITSNWGSWTATANGLEDHVATAPTNWGTWATSPTGLVDRPATAPTPWGTWTASVTAVVGETGAIITNWGTWTATATGVVNFVATIATNWGTWAATWPATVSRTATTTPSWGTWTATATGLTDHAATTTPSWGTWTATGNASVNRPATTTPSWGTWTATANGTGNFVATAPTNWGTWTATGNGDIPGKVSGTIATNWGSWTATATGLTNHVATAPTNWGTWTAAAAGVVSKTATVASNWGTWATSPAAIVSRDATGISNYGTWTAAGVASIKRDATIVSDWGTWSAAANGAVTYFGTIATNWGTWDALAVGRVNTILPGTINTNWGTWTGIIVGITSLPGTVLNEADALFVGNTLVTAVYAGTHKVWPPL